MTSPAEMTVERLLAQGRARHEPGIDPMQDEAVTRQLMLDCIGDRQASPRYILWRCWVCGRTRTTRETTKFPCTVCGATRVRPYKGEITNAILADAVRETEAIEKVQSRTDHW